MKYLGQGERLVRKDRLSSQVQEERETLIKITAAKSTEQGTMPHTTWIVIFYCLKMAG